jgi:hypothetical protein
MKTNKFVDKAIAVFFIVLSGILFYQYNNINKRSNDIIEDYKNYVQEQKVISIKKIAKLEKEIVETNKYIIALKNNQERYEHSIDSLKLVKNKIKVIYKEKIIEVNSFDNKQVEDYFIYKFQNEF